MENERKVMICPKCGSVVEISENQTLGLCSFCDSLTPLPFFITSKDSFDSETYKNMLNRVNKANSFSLTHQFHRAFNLYDKLIKNYYNLDIEDYYPYFGKALAQYGVTYSINEKLENELICLKIVKESIYENENYIRAIELSDINTEAVLKQTALLIDQFQKDVKKELIKATPIDVCILVDDTSKNKDAKVDKALASRILEKLTKAGFTCSITNDLLDKVNKEFVIDIHKQLLMAEHLVVVSSDSTYLNEPLFRHAWMSYFTEDELNETILKRMSVVTNNIDIKEELPISNVEFFLTTNLDEHVNFVVNSLQEVLVDNEKYQLEIAQYSELNKKLENKEFDEVRNELNKVLEQGNLDYHQWWIMFLAKHKISSITDIEDKAINLQDSYYFQKAYITSPRCIKKHLHEYYLKCMASLEKLSAIDEEYDNLVLVAQKNLYKKSVALLYLSTIPVILASLLCYLTISVGNITQILLMIGINAVGYFFFVKKLLNVLSLGKVSRALSNEDEKNRYFQQIKKALKPEEAAKFLPSRYGRKMHLAGYVLLVICVLMTSFIVIKESVIKVKNKNLDYYYIFNSVVITGGSGEKIIVPSIIGGKDVIKIDDEAFKSDSDLKELIISNGIKEIGDNAFSDCKKLVNVTVPASIKKLGKTPFEDSIYIKEFLYQGKYFSPADFLGNDYQKEMIVEFITPNNK
ncbi:MAG: leucine-rich repeat protein [Bacilli bacterium]|nr:leucine-rich repeat protein [Bacilli bacterium]